MASSKVKTVLSWVVLVPVGLLYLLAGAGKFSSGAIEMFANWGYAAWFAKLIGVLEVAGGVGLLIPKTTRIAIFGLTIVMLGAAYTHLANGEGLAVLRPGIFLALMWAGLWLRDWK